MPQIFIKIKEFFLKHETKIVLFIGFCLVSAISYQFGVLQGQKWQQKPLVIEKPSDTQEVQQTPIQGNSSIQEAISPASTASAPKSQQLEAKSSQCAFVGSKNSDKFYLPTCSYAKRVKPENLVCFKSAEEATGQGRTESKCSK